MQLSLAATAPFTFCLPILTASGNAFSLSPSSRQVGHCHFAHRSCNLPVSTAILGKVPKG